MYCVRVFSVRFAVFAVNSCLFIFLAGMINAAIGFHSCLWAAEPSGIQAELEAEQARLLSEERALMEQISGQAGVEPAVAAVSRTREVSSDVKPSEKPFEEQIAAEKPAATETLVPPGSGPLQAVASPLPAKRYQDQWRGQDAARPLQARTPEAVPVRGKVGDLERAVESLREENSEMRETLKALETKLQTIHAGQLDRNDARARFAPSVDKSVGQEDGCELQDCERKVLSTGSVASPRAILRAGPNQVSTRIATLQQGERLTVELSRGEWVRVVTAGGVKAWLPMQDVVFD